MGSEAERCDVCGAVLHWSPLVEGLPKMSTVSDCGHVVKLDEPTAEQKVKAKWPDAILVNMGNRIGFRIYIVDTNGIYRVRLGQSSTEESAWADAASRLSEGEQ